LLLYRDIQIGTLSSGTFELVVKQYEQGKLSKHIAGLQVGQSLAMVGPYGGVDLKLGVNQEKKDTSFAASIAASMRVGVHISKPSKD
jgi:hypothetical protein